MVESRDMVRQRREREELGEGVEVEGGEGEGGTWGRSRTVAEK